MCKYNSIKSKNIIEAIQWNGSNLSEIKKLCNKKTVEFCSCKQDCKHLKIVGNEEDYYWRIENIIDLPLLFWLIKKSNGKFSRSSDIRFKKNYRII
jgi:hypothetical protein